MKKSTKVISFMLVIILAISVIPITSTAANDFSDVKATDWFYEAVTYAEENGIMNGTSSTTFSPYGKVTRATIAQLIYNWQGRPAIKHNEINDDYTITDVSENDWYYNAAYWVSENGILSCYWDLSFKPNQAITREEVALTFRRYFSSDPIAKEYTREKLRTFSDYKDVSSWADHGMSFMTHYGFYNGDNNNRIRPQGLLTRAEMTQIIYNMREYL